MGFVELHRCFVPIAKDEEAELDIGRNWGRRFAGWIDWPVLLEYRRVVLLAEASSGKTAEFRNQAETLTSQGKTAFYVTIEDLADEGFEETLPAAGRATSHRWRDLRSEEEAWFFLDSIDEARLNHKSLQRALRRLARDIEPGVSRARVYLSCRVSDWKGREDREMVEGLLPVWEKPAAPASHDPDAALLDPLFSKDEPTRSFPEEEPERKKEELLVVQLVPLSAEQRGELAAASGIDRPREFTEEIERQGLGALADRPGDLLDLIVYWKENGRFGSRAQMTEHGIARKLSERDPFRRDSQDLPNDKARRGAERLAAALTLTKSLTLRAPGHDPDPTLAVGALEAAEVLDTWNDAERTALLRRGAFAPASYGRIRFHHRGTQEYLAGCWLDRMIQAGGYAAVWDLLFADRYAVQTLVPSLHAATAWLSLRHPAIRNEVIRREPLVLLRHGDPGSLPLETKEALLLTYATRHAEGEISRDRLDHRDLWMFASPDLGGAIRKAWAINDREDFRADLLRLVREGAIRTCVDLARGAIFDEERSDYYRTVALQALDACGDTEGLAAAAEWLKSAPEEAGTRLGPDFAEVLFPRHLSVDELLRLIERSTAPREHATDGFGYALADLWDACPGEVRERFLGGLADLCLTPPFVEEYQRVSSRHQELARHLAPIARAAVLALGDREAPEGLVRVLIAVEHSDRQESHGRETPSLRDLVSGNLPLQRSFFWADVEQARQNTPPGQEGPTSLWDINLMNTQLWQLGPSDLPWLYEDLSGRTLEGDKRVALSAILQILKSTDALEAEVARLRERIATHPLLVRDLEGYLSPPTMTEARRRFLQQVEESRRTAKEKEERNRAGWRKFREEVSGDPSVLRDPKSLKEWLAGAYRLQNLSVWLRRRTGKGTEEAVLQWRLLEEGFGLPVAEAFREGMKVLWRVTAPERPVHAASGQNTVKHTTALSLAGLAIEAAEDPEWASRLSPAEAEQAARHACLSEQGYPGWFDALVDRHPLVLTILRATLQEEWSGLPSGRSMFLEGHGYGKKSIRRPVQEILFEVMTGTKPKDTDMLRRGLRILPRLQLDDGQCRRVALAARRRLRTAARADEEDALLVYLSILFLVDAERATHFFIDWLDSSPPESREARAIEALGTLFGESGSALASTLVLSVAGLESLVRLAYRHVRREDDRAHEGTWTPDARDRAEEARNALLSALLRRPGAEAYQTMRRLAADPAFRISATRFKELAHGKAEYDAEPPAWSPSEVLTFERHRLAPAKTGEDLLRIVMGVLSDIQLSFSNADATSRPLVEGAKDEEQVQQWLAERMNEHARGRYHVHREAQVAGGDKPDLIVASTSAPVEVAVEVKHGGMNWTVPDLEQALRQQLAESYLKPEARRHGILVISYHRRRTWRPGTGKSMSFPELIAHLQRLAETLNTGGRVKVQVFGIDTTQR